MDFRVFLLIFCSVFVGIYVTFLYLQKLEERASSETKWVFAILKFIIPIGTFGFWGFMFLFWKSMTFAVFFPLLCFGVGLFILFTLIGVITLLKMS